MADAQYARFETMTNVELRAELKRRGCPTSGNKKDLLGKLRAALDKEFGQTENNNNDNSVGITQNETQLSTLNQYSTPVIPVPEQLSVLPSDEPSPPPPPPQQQQISENSSITDNQDSVLENSNNLNEVNSFVSKSNETEEEEKNIEKIGDHTHLPVVADSSKSQTDTSESNIKQNTPDNDQQPAIDQTNGQTENKESIETVPTKTTEENESRSSTENKSLKVNRSQSISSVKFPTRSILNKINLNLELLQTLIPDVSLLSESVVNDELDSDQNNESILEANISNDFQSADSSMTIGELADQKVNSSNRTVAIDDISTRKKSNPAPVRIASFEGKNNGVIGDEPVRMKEPSVTNEPPSEILYIRGLTRPFSLMQLKGLLSRYGTLVDGDFWLDKIKSQCFVRYNTIEEAQNARQELDGCRWPSTNPKTLLIRFAQQDEIEYCKTHDAPPDHLSNENTDRVVEERMVNTEEDFSSKLHTNGSKPLKEKQSAFLITDDEDIQDDDDENIDEQSAVKSADQPAKGLDDYFRKTKAKPSIYWLPLTEEQVIERNRRQEQRKAERDEEQRKRTLDENQRKNEKRKRSVSPSRRDFKRH